MTLHLAQMNIGRVRAPIDSPVMAGFVARLAEINALAEASDGFVWRFQGGSGNATYLRRTRRPGPFGPGTIGGSGRTRPTPHPTESYSRSVRLRRAHELQ
ncbi:MAG: DUF3291 domain-containing protein [Acidobacteria bacterium]|nr:DUF3291 domain-containing protein [Acidobacteriota bacterium]